VCEEFDMIIATVAINGGEGLWATFTIAMEDFEKIKANFSIIGHILTQEVKFI
jgi:thiamine-monophosphate kinase